MKEILSKIYIWIKEHKEDIILVVGVILISLISFSMGYIAAKNQEKEPVRLEKTSINSSFRS